MISAIIHVICAIAGCISLGGAIYLHKTSDDKNDDTWLAFLIVAVVLFLIAVP